MGADETPAFLAGPPPPPPHVPQCSDLVDNDGDGAIDAADPGCLAGPTDDNEGDETPGDLVLCGSRDQPGAADVKGSEGRAEWLRRDQVRRAEGHPVGPLPEEGRQGEKLGTAIASADGSFRAR